MALHEKKSIELIRNIRYGILRLTAALDNLLKYKLNTAKLFTSLQIFNMCAMISKTKSALIRSLDRKKIREREGLFIVEGEKMIEELLLAADRREVEIVEIFCESQWLLDNKSMFSKLEINLTETSTSEISKISHLVTPRPVLALARIPAQMTGLDSIKEEVVLGLESIRDPGNLGTIIRTADWFGIRNIICSPDSVDAYNPKVVQSTMGALFRVKIWYLPLEEVLADPELDGKTVYGTFLGGENIYEKGLSENPLILFGNESRGISPALEKRVETKITIPSFAEGAGSESLNLASSMAIVCSEYRRTNH